MTCEACRKRIARLKRYTVLVTSGTRDYAGATIGAPHHAAAAEAFATTYDIPVRLTVRAEGNGEGERAYDWDPERQTMTRREAATR